MATPGLSAIVRTACTLVITRGQLEPVLCFARVRLRNCPKESRRNWPLYRQARMTAKAPLRHSNSGFRPLRRSNSNSFSSGT